jgi:hypothetical protein
MATYPQTPYDEPYDHSRAKEDARNEWQHYEDDPDSEPPGKSYYLACGDTLLAPEIHAPGTTLVCPRHGLTNAITEKQWFEEHQPGGPSALVHTTPQDTPEAVFVNDPNADAVMAHWDKEAAAEAAKAAPPAPVYQPDHAVDAATARKILDQLWEGVMAGLHDSRLHDELIRAGWPQFQGYAGGEAGICMHCQQPIQHCKHAMPCPEGFEHSTDLLHHCYGGVADTVAEPAAASVRPLPGHPVLEGAGYDCHCGACEAQPGYVPRQKLQPTE